MQNLFKQNTLQLVLVAIFVLCELIVFPTGNFPLNDDWSYAKSVLALVNDHKLDLGQWPAMTLLTHLVWGGLFTKVFGFSFFVLRLSTIISSLIGLLVLNKLVFRISGKPHTAFIASLVLLLNPFYFNLTNTFMTDVNFTTLLLLGAYFVFDFFQTKSKLSFILVFVLSILLVLLRQYGLVLPLSFFLACLFLKDKRVVWSLWALFAALITFFILKYYESYLKQILTTGSAYKFSGDMNPTQRLFWDTFFENASIRYSKIIFHLLFYTFPLSLFFILRIGLQFSKKILSLVFIISFLATYLLFRHDDFQMANVFIHYSVGTETFFETLKGTDDGFSHTYSETFETIVLPLKYGFTGSSLALMVLVILTLVKRKINPFKNKPELVFLLLLVSGYIFMICITESYFDRYHIPLIAMALIFMAYIPIQKKTSLWPVALSLLLFFYVSVFGTKDYFTLHQKSLEAYNFVKQTKTVKNEEINPGFELYNWNEGKQSWWWEFMELKNFTYLIQYDPEPGFKHLKSFPYQRYFPYRTDKINIFVKEATNQMLPDTAK